MLMSAVLLPACQSMQTVTESNATRVTSNVLRDSIYLHDSVSYTYRPAKISLPYREGVGVGSPPDTVYLEKWHTRYKDRLVTKTDTVTNEVIRTETVQVRYVPSFYKYCAAFAILFVLFLLVRLVLYIKRHFFL